MPHTRPTFPTNGPDSRTVACPQRGFTLIEIMVVVGIISILTAIALPSYNQYATKGRIPEATSELSARRAKLETYYDNNRTYVGAPDCASSSGKNFSFSCSATATTYTITASGTGSMAGFTYTIDQDNARKTTSAGSGWTANSSCWVMSKDGSC